MNYRQIIARQKSAEARILKAFGRESTDKIIRNESGIYILKRTDENGIRYAYIGQAKKLITRLGQHLLGYQHIDLSLKKHGFYEKDKNPYGYIIDIIYCPEIELDQREKEFIQDFANQGFQLRNKTSGGQGQGKVGIDENKPSKGYYDGKKQGRIDTIKEVKNYFDKYLDYSIKGEPNKIKSRKKKEFEELLNETSKAN